MKPMKTISENMMPKKQLSGRNAHGFTLIELLVVIAIIGVLAAFTVVSVKGINKTKKISSARADLEQVKAALEDYYGKYHVYPPGNQNSPVTYTAPQDRAQFNQLYYELSGVTINGAYFVTLDGSAQIKIADVNTAFGVGGFVNCSKGSAEDASPAKNCLHKLVPSQYYSPMTNAGIPTTILVTSAGGPDDNYQPLKVSGVNPIRYVYPGVQNPGGYDLWVQLVISGKTNLVCNWSKNVLVNNPLP